MRLKRPDFKLAQLSFCQSARELDSVCWTSEAEMDEQKVQAELACLKLKLGVEQALFQQHVAQVQEWESSSANARLVHLETIDKLVEDATVQYCDARFPSVHLSEKDEATPWVNNGRRETVVKYPMSCGTQTAAHEFQYTLGRTQVEVATQTALQRMSSESSGTIDGAQVMLYVANLTYLGVGHSAVTHEVVRALANLLASSPSRSGALLILPNTAQVGLSHIHSDAMVTTARRAVCEKVEAEMWGVESREFSFHFEESEMYSDKRPLFHSGLLLVKKVAPEEAQSVFTKSALWLRKAIPGTLPVLQRSDFAQPLDDENISVIKKSLSEAAEYKQHCSGVGFWKGMLAAVTRGLGRNRRDTIACVDFTPYDATLPQACVELNVAATSTSPAYSCLSISWLQPDSGKRKVAAYVHKRTRDRVACLVRDGTLRLPGVPEMTGDTGLAVTKKPTLATDKF